MVRTLAGCDGMGKGCPRFLPVIARLRGLPDRYDQPVFDSGSSMMRHASPNTPATRSAVTTSAGAPAAITSPARIAMMWSA